MSEDLGDLVARAVAGDAEARAAIVAAHRDAVHRYLVTMLGDAAVAEELTQEAFRVVFTKLETLKDPARLRSWIFTIAINQCRSWLRQRADERRPDNAEALAGEQASSRRTALSSVLHREAAEILALAVDRLPVLLREAFVLRFVEDFSYAEMEEACGVSSRTLHVRAHRAKALLRRQLGKVVETWWTRDDP